MNFIFTEANYQLARNRGRSILMVCVSLLLCGCIAFYLGNIISSQQALDNINDSTPAIVNICNPVGDSKENLNISTTYVDLLLDRWEMKDIRTTCQAAGAYSEGARSVEPKYFSGGDTSMLGINCIEAIGLTDERYMTFADGYDSSMFAGKEALCIISEDYAEDNGLKTGDDLTLPIYLCKYSANRLPTYFAMYDSDTWEGDDYEIPPDWTLRIVGTFTHKLNPTRAADVYLPVEWLRETTDSQDLPFSDYTHRLSPFSYSTFQCAPVDSMRLNEMKLNLLDIGFGIPFYQPRSDRLDYVDYSAGSSIWMDDEDFIKTAEKLAEAVRTYRAFMIPFFLVVTLLVTMAMILVLRGARRDMAVALSLGRPKKTIALVHLLAALGAQALGCLLALPAAVLIAGLGLGMGLAICGAFMICALLGDLLGLWGLLRFDAMELLTRTD